MTHGEPVFDFVLGRVLDKNNPELISTYAYHKNEIHRMSAQWANVLLNYANASVEKDQEKFSIYKVTYTKI